MKKSNFSITIFFLIFGLAGIGMIVLSVFLYINGIKFKETAVPVTAIIESIETYRDSDGDLNHRTYVSYSFDGIKYNRVPLGEYSSSMYEGKIIDILCDPNNPRYINTSGALQTAPVIVLVMGIIFAAVGIVPLITNIKKNTKRKRLLATGHVIHATVTNIDCNYSYSVNGRHPFIIDCSYVDEYSGVTYLFRSDNLWTDPSLAFSVGSYIDVYVDPDNYSNYIVNAEAAISARVMDFT